MKEQFIPYEQALKLKELGFDEGCLTYYFIGGKMSNYFKKVHKNSRLIQTQPYKFHCSSPLWQQAFDWFREKYNLHSFIDRDGGWYLVNIKDLSNEEIEGSVKIEIKKSYFITFEEAQQACLEKLIEIVESSIFSLTNCGEDCAGCEVCCSPSGNDGGLCSCGIYVGVDNYHTCPFAEEVRGDFESLCNCCESCSYNCAMDV